MTTTESRSRGRQLRRGVIGRTESAVVGVASTAPAYSLAVTVGLLVSYVGAAAPLVLAVSAIPIVLMALCFRELNNAEPDCGTTFAWAEKAFGVGLGRMVGWTSIMACVLVMSNLAQVSAIYTYDLVGWEAGADSRVAQAVLGTFFIALMAYLAYRGIEVAARVQGVLLTAEVGILIVFAIAAFSKAGFDIPAFSQLGEKAWGAAFLAAVFLYWGWDSSFSMNEESVDPQRTPAFGALAANAVLIVLYVVVAWAAISYAGVDRLTAIGEDDFFVVLGNELMNTVGGKLLIGMVLVSALASTQTTILPTARTMLSMARRDAFPGRFARISPRYQTPSYSTAVFAAVSAVIYVVLVLISDSVLEDSVAAVAVLVSLYYLATAFAVPFYFNARRVKERRLQRLVIPMLAIIMFGFTLIFAVVDVGFVPLVVVGVSLMIGTAIMFSMRPHDEEISA